MSATIRDVLGYRSNVIDQTSSIKCGSPAYEQDEVDEVDIRKRSVIASASLVAAKGFASSPLDSASPYGTLTRILPIALPTG